MRKWLRRRFQILPGVGRDGANLRAMRLRHIVPVRQPLVLISQANRSGGTLLGQLMAGHPDCHVHPGELHIGYPQKVDWPRFDLGGSPNRWFRMLVEDRLPQYARHGFSKPGRGRAHYREEEIVFPFLFLRNLQRRIFRRVLSEEPVTSARQILDAYHTSFFNAWLDYQGLYQPKKYVVGFTPHLASREEEVANFFRDYPDGRMLSVVRDPKSWFVSLRGKKPTERADPRGSIGRWMRSAEAALRNTERYPGRVMVIAFERLVGETEPVMREIASFLEIRFDPIMVEPTFQGMPIRANSSFVTREAGVSDAPLRRAAQLSPEDASAIESETAELYERVRRELFASRVPRASDAISSRAYESAGR